MGIARRSWVTFSKRGLHLFLNSLLASLNLPWTGVVQSLACRTWAVPGNDYP